VTNTNPNWTLLQIIAWQATKDISLVRGLRKEEPDLKNSAVLLDALGVLRQYSEDIDEVCIGRPAQEIIESHISGRITLFAGVTLDELERIDRAALSNTSIYFSRRHGLYIRTNPANSSAGIGVRLDGSPRRGAPQISGYKPTADPIKGALEKLDNHAWLDALPKQATKEKITVCRPEWHNICAVASEVQLALPGGPD